MKRLAIIGSTGSIGRQTLDVVRWHPHEFEVAFLAARDISERFQQQVEEFNPASACLVELSARHRLPEAIARRVEAGTAPLHAAVCDPSVDLVVVASSGTVGFEPTIAALRAGKPVALANKETLIMAGHLVQRAAREGGAPILPIDSEHSAIWQCLQGEEPWSERVRRLILTASGGALRDVPVDELTSAPPERALRHPTWSMGQKITIDSATLMNKGLEVIEAHWLFEIPYERIEAVIHHQSVIHSLVEMVDGSVKAQLGTPDMRLPIQYALAYPRRLHTPVPSLDLLSVGGLSFAPVEPRRYPCLALAYQAGRGGGSLPTVLNAANEVAVARYLREDLAFGDIPRLIQDTLEEHAPLSDPTLDEVLAADAWARALARSWKPLKVAS